MILKLSLLAGGTMEFFEKIFGWLGTIFEAMLSIIPKTLYLLVTFCMQIVDIIQLFFQKLAGLDVYYIEGSDTAQSGDFLIYFMRKVLFEKGTLNTAFWSIAVVGLFLLVFATLVAVLRTQYNYDDKPVSPMKVVGKAIKSLLSFILIPVVCFFGVFLGNIFLQALNSATSVENQPTSSVASKLEQYTLSDGTKSYSGVSLFGHDIGVRTDTFSGMVFRAASYRANRIRNEAGFRSICDGNSEIADGSVYRGVTMGLFTVQGNDYETAATTLDDAFVYNYKLNFPAYANITANAESGMTTLLGVIYNDFTTVLYALPYKTFSRYNVAWVWFYYDLWQFDFVMAVAAIIALAIIYINLVTAMMKRAIELTMLLIISPAVVSLTPLDDGAMLKRWKENFVKKTLAAYGAVVGINLLFLILPYIRDINFFNIPIVDAIVQLFFTIVALSCIKDFMKLLSDVAGGEDAQATGAEANKKVVDTVKKVGSVAAAVAAPGAALISKSLGGKVVGGIGKKIGNTRPANWAKEKWHNHKEKDLSIEDRAVNKERRSWDRTNAKKYSNDADRENAFNKHLASAQGQQNVADNMSAIQAKIDKRNGSGAGARFRRFAGNAVYQPLRMIGRGMGTMGDTVWGETFAMKPEDKEKLSRTMMGGPITAGGQARAKKADDKRREGEQKSAETARYEQNASDSQRQIKLQEETRDAIKAMKDALNDFSAKIKP